MFSHSKAALLSTNDNESERDREDEASGRKTES